MYPGSMWWLLACTAVQDSSLDEVPRGDSGGGSPTGETGRTDDSGTTPVVPTSFTLGEVETCTAPTTAAWSDTHPVSVYDEPTGPNPTGTEPGGVAVVGNTLYWLRDGGLAVAMDLEAGIASELGWTNEIAGLSLADLDHDGLDDLILTGFNPGVVWAVGTAEEAITLLTRGSSERWARDISPGDVNGDGVEDLFFTYTGLPSNSAVLASDVLFGNGDRTFSDPVPVVTEGPFWGRPFDATLLDLDGDSDPDVYLCNDLGNLAPNGVLLNDGRGGFTPGGAGWGLDLRMNCMGAAWGDVNRDGDLDVYLSDTFRQYLLVDEGDLWVDEAAARGLGQNPELGMGWGSAVTDADNDGLPDVILALGDFWTAETDRYEVGLYLQDETGGTFKQTDQLRAVAAGRGVVAADVNEDHVVDFLVGDAFRSPWTMLSAGCTADHWVEVEAPPGSRVVVEADGLTWGALASHEHGWASAGPSRVHVGLGAIDTVDRVTVYPLWSGPQALEGPIAADRRILFHP